MTTQYINLDDTLKLMKAELRREFPAVRFSVRRSRGTGYGFVSVRWTDGPTVREVTAITSGYEGEGFDGMTDSSFGITHTAATGKGEPVTIQYGTRGISCSREISPTLARQLAAAVAEKYGITMPEITEYVSQYTGESCWKLENDSKQLVGHFYASDLIHQAASETTR